ncbi:hypothetical protein [Emticicia sp. BO119]|uniref:hypothetical protein n=1 Tax=Emticicia sp. BO119 TaxID=2757768 RepID=UPI0015EFFD99|nr:hypothetical protein [Emticicia sp. BO119]MBA4849519.1 hypothetical protein [Emticicia sp. BO119]
MKKIFTIAIVTILTSTAAFANDDTNKQTSKEETSKVVITKETMKLIKKERKKTSKVFREKNLVC